MAEKCKTCVGRLEYKSSFPCNRCIWNTEESWYSVPEQSKKDWYREVIIDPNCDLPY